MAQGERCGDSLDWGAFESPKSRWRSHKVKEPLDQKTHSHLPQGWASVASLSRVSRLSPLWETVRRPLKKLRLERTCDPRSPTSGCVSEENKNPNPERYLCPVVIAAFSGTATVW